MELAERAAHGVQGPDERAWVEEALADYDNVRAAFVQHCADRDWDLAVRLVAAVPELVHLRIGYEASGWAERVLADADPHHPRYVAAVGAASRGRGTAVSSPWPRAWRAGRTAGCRPRAARASRTRGRARRRRALRGDVDRALRHYAAAAERARADGERIRLVWTLYYVAVCQAVRREPQKGVAAAQECLDVAEETANPTARSMARYALGLVLKKSEPERALTFLDEAAELAASVRNFWWHGIAMMEAAATRAVHGDPVAAARAFLTVLDHWDKVGDATQQWLNLRYVARLLNRVDAGFDAASLHAFLVAAGKPSPLGPERTPEAGPRPGSVVSTAAAVAHARAALRRVA
ncbi:hypothetical protein [Blastococcus brunescens]|uniref:Uncharacterized protein n=1 Tax=Blastococcus brunescens TaxID=1564165 RepID=A0ABZ1B3K4_9ACTN|nr:hypothetical protein [Blastococcus sp. BMG 8361]WRL65392.1 hypothetical protein U6N30_07095 [Blastococcus sp. BMG 8361]